MADISRRSFIKWVISAGVASACPIPILGQDKKEPAGPASVFKSESNEVCHKVRDQEEFPIPAPSQEYDVVIVGGGPSGLAAADHIQDQNFLLLEKEPQLGGNAYAEEWEGRPYSTGAAFAIVYDEMKPLMEKWKFDLKTIKGLDAACFDGVWIKNFWTGTPDNPALDQLPYSDSVKNSFRKFAADVQAIDLEKNLKTLDNKPFSDYLEGYAPEVRTYWDTFGPSNWGCASADTSAALGLEAAQVWPTQERKTFEGGMGVGSRKIYESLSEGAKKRILLNSAVYQVEKKGKKVWISFMHHGQAVTISARSVIMATPKFITKFLVMQAPQKQRLAMDQIRYAPYLTINLCFDRVVYNQAYDNWVIGNKNFTDFIVADWVTYADGGDLNRKQVLTVYSCRPESERRDILTEEGTLAKAKLAVEDLIKMFPGWEPHLKEVRIFRRGHPMFLPTPGLYTKGQKQAGKDFKPIFFAHSDNYGNISDFGYATLNGIEAAKKALKIL